MGRPEGSADKGRPSAICIALFRCLVSLYPRPFRERFAREMEQVWVAAWRQPQTWPRAHRMGALADLFVAAASLRWAQLVARLGLGSRPRNDSRVHRAISDRAISLPKDLEHHGDEAVSWMQDLRYAWRALRRVPALGAVVVFTLALGIGATTAMISVIDGVLLRPLPYPEAERLVLVWENDRLRGTQREGVSAPDWEDLKDGTSSFTGIGIYARASMALTGTGEPQQLSGASVSHELFSVIGQSPALGRSFEPADDGPGAEPVAVISHGLWQRAFAGRPETLGRSVVVDGLPYTVVGVMPPGDTFPSEVEVWLPLAAGPHRQSLEFRGNHSFLAVGRLAEGTDIEQAQMDLSRVMSRLEQAYPDDNKGRGAWAEPMMEVFVGPVRPALLTLMVAVLLVLVVACVNVANLLLAQAMSREREVAVRGAMGAGRWRLIRQFLLEGLLLSSLGGLLGAVLATGGLRLLLSLADGSLPRAANVGIDFRVLAATAAIAMLTGLLFGLAPALHVVRTDIQAKLREGARGQQGVGRLRLRRLLVVAELALATLLVVGAGLLVRSFLKLGQVDPGFRPQGLANLQVILPEGRYPQVWTELPHWPKVQSFAEQLLERTRALPGVQSAGLAYLGPTDAGWTTRFAISGRPEVPPGEREEARLRPISPGYLETAGITLVAGRGFSDFDREDSPPVVLINQAMARAYFPGEDPVGQRLSYWDQEREIVGVVSDVRFRGRERAVPMAMYPPYRQQPFGQITLLARGHGEGQELLSAMGQLVRELDSDLPLLRSTTTTTLMADATASRRFSLVLLGIFACVALLLAAVGTYGMVSYSVSRRLFEIGLRQSLGANRRDILDLILGEGLRTALLGVGLGLAAALALGRLVSSLLYGVSPRDPLTYAAVAGLLLLMALLASFLPALRATRVAPVQALRHE